MNTNQPRGVDVVGEGGREGGGGGEFMEGSLRTCTCAGRVSRACGDEGALE